MFPAITVLFQHMCREANKFLALSLYLNVFWNSAQASQTCQSRKSMMKKTDLGNDKLCKYYCLILKRQDFITQFYLTFDDGRDGEGMYICHRLCSFLSVGKEMSMNTQLLRKMST